MERFKCLGEERGSGAGQQYQCSFGCQALYPFFSFYITCLDPFRQKAHVDVFDLPRFVCPEQELADPTPTLVVRQQEKLYHERVC